MDRTEDAKIRQRERGNAHYHRHKDEPEFKARRAEVRARFYQNNKEKVNENYNIRYHTDEEFRQKQLERYKRTHARRREGVEPKKRGRPPKNKPVEEAVDN